MSNKRTHKNKFKINKLFSGMGMFVLLFAVGVGLTSFIAARNLQVGEEILIMADYSHVEEGTDPGPYNSNPPTSGLHYPEDLKAGFYDENVYEYPEGYLVHNLEHGYIIFWYNCSLLSDSECQVLTSQIENVMQAEDNYKVIAYPWETTDTPLVLTSWGRLMRFDSFDEEAVLDFIHRNRNKAPEPNAD